MAAVPPPPPDAADLMENLSLEPQTKSLEIPDPVKKTSVENGNNKIQPGNKAATPLVSDFMDPGFGYYPSGYPYYYGGYDGTTNDWTDYSRYMSLDGSDLAHGVYGYGYPPYGTYSPDGYSAQHYQYPSPFFQPPNPTCGPKGDTTTPAKGDQLTVTANASKGVGPKGNTGSVPVKPAPYQNSVYNANSGYRMGAQYCYPNKLYGQYGNAYKSGYCYGTNAYGLPNSARGWVTVDNKFKSRVRGNGFCGYNNDNSDGLNELNRGPRTRTTKTLKPITSVVVKGQDLTLSSTDSVENESKEVKEVNLTPDREQYNKEEFPETYADAKFFIIKSYSEDDVHKSIKYNVWASTQNGNKKLNAAYHEAQEKSEGCPVFLFFSVNTSGQFVGVAEMVGPVDFNKSLEYWQQDKWVGCFPVKWHIVKDLPNNLLKHIVLEYNENKPVTNSRDTQEVKLVHGLQMVKIFKEHSSKQCILDDFEFYEDRQKKIQQKKAKQQQYQKQSLEGKLVDKIKEGIEGDALKSDDEVSGLVNEVKLVDSVQDEVKPGEMNVVLNGVANAC